MSLYVSNNGKERLNTSQIERRSSEAAASGSELKKQIAMCQYTQEEQAQITTHLRLLFAVNSENTKPRAHILRTGMTQLPGLRFRPHFAEFTLFPRSERTLVVNRFLWETAQKGFYDSGKGSLLFGEHVFALGLPEDLFVFLRHVSLEALDMAIIDFLVLYHHQLISDGDIDGVNKLQEELLPLIWEKVRLNNDVLEDGGPREPERSATLEDLVLASFMSPGKEKVDVLAGYLSTSDMDIFLYHGPLELSHRLRCLGADFVGVPGSTILKLYRDWLVFDDIFCEHFSMKRTVALEAMDRAMHSGRCASFYEEAASVIDICETQNSFFSLLPLELVAREVVPWIVRQSCETMSPICRDYDSRLAMIMACIIRASRPENMGRTRNVIASLYIRLVRL